MKLIALILLAATQAHAASYVISQYGASDVVSASSDFVTTCAPYESPENKPNLKRVTRNGFVQLTTTSGVLNIEVSGSSLGVYGPKPGPYVQKDRQDACDHIKDDAEAAIANALQTLYDVKSGMVRKDPKDRTCYVNEIQITHAGSEVRNYKYTFKLVPCP